MSEKNVIFSALYLQKKIKVLLELKGQRMFHFMEIPKRKFMRAKNVFCPKLFFPSYIWEAKLDIFNYICTKILFSPLHLLPRRKILIEEDPSSFHFFFQYF